MYQLFVAFSCHMVSQMLVNIDYGDVWQQAITWTDLDFLSSGPLQVRFSEI